MADGFGKTHPIGLDRMAMVFNGSHFLLKTNSEIERLSTPALEPLAKRARMEHVDESEESQVTFPNY